MSKTSGADNGADKRDENGGLPASGVRPLGGEGHLLLRVENLAKSYALVGESNLIKSRPGPSTQTGGASGKTHGEPAVRRLQLFERLTFSVPRGQILAIVGQSGAGKSTLLHLLGALDRPTAGRIWLGETALTNLSGLEAARFRNREVGYVWQFHYLLPEFTAEENVSMPLMARGMKAKPAGEIAAGWLERVGLADRRRNRAGELSGGEQQRVSLARALITEPKLLLADEPTGDLDGKTADTIFALVEELHREQGLTTVLVTHNMALARRCHRVLRLSHDGMNEVSAEELPPYVE